ncbi:hypothetical protein MRX96_000687 [Rhipicephalus microplus]
MERLSRLDKARRRLFLDDTSLLRRPGNLRRATSVCGTGLPTRLHEDETPQCRVSWTQQRGQSQKLLPHDADQPSYPPEEEVRLLWCGSSGKVCLNRTKGSFSSTGPRDNQSDDFASHRSLAGKKSKRAGAAKHSGDRSRKQREQTSKRLVLSDSSEAFAVAERQKDEVSARQSKLKTSFSRLAVPMSDKVRTSKEKKVGSHEGGLLKLLDAESQRLTGNSANLVEEPPSECRPPGSRVCRNSGTYSSESDPFWNRGIGDCSESNPKTLQPLRKAIDRLSPVRGECDGTFSPITTYIYHEMRKGGLGKNSRPLSNRNRVPQETSQNYAPSPSSDHVGYREASKLAPLERSSPTGRTPEGKPLLKASGLGASGTASASTATPRAQVLPHLVGQGYSDFECRGTGAALLLSESPAVEEQQPFKRILLFKKKAAVCLGVLLFALALFAWVSAPFLYSKVIVTAKPQLFKPRMPGSFPVAKNGSFVAHDATEEEYDTCSTPACKRDGAYLKGLLSWDLDPCEDFYHFVCSRWKSSGETTKTNVAAASSDELDHQLEQSVHGVLQRGSSAENLATLKALFDECMNTRQLDLDDWNPMLELLWLVSLEGFPFSFTPRNSTSLWKIAARVLKMTGAKALISIQANAHPTKVDVSILSIGMPNMLAPKGSDQAQVTEFYNSTAFAGITALKKQRNPTAYSLEVAAFASRLEMLVYSYSVSVGPPTHRVMLLKTQPELSTFCVELFLNSDSPLYSGGHTELLIQSPAFFDALVTLLRNTDHYIVMNYLGIRLMIEVAAYAPLSGRPLVDTLVQHIYGRPRPLLPRWKLCVRSAERALPDLFLYASELAFKTHFAVDMVQRLLGSARLQLVRSLSRLTVLDRDSRARAAILLNSTRFRLFRPDWLNNQEKLESHVTALPRVVRGQSLRSFYTLHSHSFTESLRREEADRWHGSAFDHDCTFDGNTVYVPVLLFNFTKLADNILQSLQISSSGVRIVRCLLQMLMTSVASGSSAGCGRQPCLVA